MKPPIRTIENAARSVKELKGMTVRLKVNRGRNKITEYTGDVQDAYPSIFTLKTAEGLESFSYRDILTGNILFYRVKKSE